MREAGIPAIGFKPVVAGTYVDASGQKLNEDLETLRIASGLNLHERSLCPFVLDEAAAPHLVAQKSDVRIDATLILDEFNALTAEFDAVVVEGAGGFLVPLNEQEDLGDVAQAMDNLRDQHGVSLSLDPPRCPKRAPQFRALQARTLAWMLGCRALS